MAVSSVKNRLRSGLLPALMLAGLALLAVIGANAPAHAQSLPMCNQLDVGSDGETPSISPNPPTTLFLTGEVTVGGERAQDGLRIQARVDGACIGAEDIVGISGVAGDMMRTPGRYELSVAADPRDHAFDTITFHLEDGTPAAETELFIDYADYDIRKVVAGDLSGDSRMDPQRNWGSTSRILDLSFPAPPPPPAVEVEHTIFVGRAFTPAHPTGLEGVQLLARVGDYTTDPAVVTTGGSYRIVVNPDSEDALGQNIEFFLEGFPDDIAVETPVFNNVGGSRMLDLNFPRIDRLSGEPEEPEPVAMFGSIIYRGTVSSVSSPGGIEGVQIEARVGTAYTSAPAIVGSDNQYLIVLNPSAELAPTLVGEPITFHIIVEDGEDEPMPAFQQYRYIRSDDGTTLERNLVFPADSEPSGGDCFGGSGFAASNLLLLIVPALVVVGLRLHSRRQQS